MEKKIISFLIGIILLIIFFVCVFRGFSIGKISIYSIQQIKEADTQLDAKVAEATTIANQEYKQRVADIATSISNLKDIKEEYQNTVNSLGIDIGLGTTQIEKYKIEYLWTKIGNYAEDRKLKMNFDIKETSIEDTYNIDFTLSGSYGGITDFLYNIEDDDELNYIVKNFNIQPTTTTETSTTNNTSESSNTDVLQATFTVENVIIKFN